MSKQRYQQPGDAIKKRREYLRKKVVAASAIAMVCVVGSLTVLAALLLTMGVVIVTTPADSPYRPLGMAIIILVPSLILLGFINAYKSEVKRAAAIPYNII